MAKSGISTPRRASKDADLLEVLDGMTPAQLAAAMTDIRALVGVAK